jgi:DNA primase
MSFTPHFLDELRARVSLAGIVGRSVRLARKGHEFQGLCPFHKEKTPSFYVVEEKGFYHCFGCGAHGDAIGFTMQSRNLAFPEAVEELAKEAGLEVPRASPEERRRVERQVTLQSAMEAAAVFFSEQLFRPAGAAALAYLKGRGLDEGTIRRFRLGFAPDTHNALKSALGASFPEELLIEGGLLRRSEDRGTTYDYFRGRAIFPIGDRSGRVIAFGGRIMGEGQPKYLNSPETPIFQKGRVLYGWAPARAAASRTPSAIVTEGYMDVIGLHRAGFTTAVAPLGTALTEAHLEELWKLAPEPVLCFDGDAAGRRAASRALDRALPLLKPGLSLRVAVLPQGEDPDTLVLRHGAEAMRAVLDQARPLAEELWALEVAGRPVDTPERRAALEQRIEAKVRGIGDRSVQEHYRRFFRDRFFTAWRPTRPGRAPTGARAIGKVGARPTIELARQQPDPKRIHAQRQQEIVLAAFINHPSLLEEFADDFAALDFPSPEFNGIRREILALAGSGHDLDAGAVKLHLCQAGFSGILEGLLSSRVYGHAGFARPDADPGAVRKGWIDVRNRLKQQPLLKAQLAEEAQGLVDEITPEKVARLTALLNSRREEEEAAADDPDM